MSDPILTLRQLATCEGDDDQDNLKLLMRANEHAPDLIVGGVLLPVDAGPIRLHEAVDDLTGETLCGCLSCEASNGVTADREEAAYYLGLAAGLRLARAVGAEDGGAS